MPDWPDWNRTASDRGVGVWFSTLVLMRKGLGIEASARKTPIPEEMQSVLKMSSVADYADAPALVALARTFLATLPTEHDRLVGQLTWAVVGTGEIPLATRSSEELAIGLNWGERLNAAKLNARFNSQSIRKLRDESDRVVLAFAEHLASMVPEERDERVQIMDYLRDVVNRNNELAVGDGTKSGLAASLVSVGNRMTLESVWTSLRVALQPPEAGSDRVESKTEKLEVLVALDQAEFRKVVLLGNPGAGKSSVVAVRAIALAKIAQTKSQVSEMVVPVHVRLKNLKVGDIPDIGDIWSGVLERTVEGQSDADLGRLLNPLLSEGRAITMFDGLDEVQEEALTNVLNLLDLFNTTYPSNPVIVTCRAFDYTLDIPNRRLPHPALYLLPFDLPQQLEYLTSWYNALKVFRPAFATEERRKNLTTSLENSKDLIALGGTPLHLALMAVVHTNKGELPENKALLYDEMISYLLAESPEWRRSESSPEPQPPESEAHKASREMLKLAYRVGFEVHKKQEAATAEFRGITSKELLDIVQDHFQLFDSGKIGSEAYKAAALKVDRHIATLIQSNGLLVDQGDQVYNFDYKQYREFLAGMHVGTFLGEFETSIPLAQRSHWRESFRLLASRAGAVDNNVDYVLHFVDELLDQQSEYYRREDATLGAEMLVDIGRSTLVTSKPKALAPSNRTRGLDGLWLRTASCTLPLISDSAVPLSMRVRAADALGGLGDPRFVEPNGTLKPLSDRVVELPAGVATVGWAGMSHPLLLEQVDSSPRELMFRSFRIGKYPVTNLEYMAFVTAGGYQDSQWWETEEARLWVSADPTFLATLEELWLRTAEFDYAPEIEDGTYTLDSLAETGRELCGTRQRPYFSEDRRLSAPTQPVVGINYWEAGAYCAWLTAQGKKDGWLSANEIVRLPTEWEWERAIRLGSPASVYQWGETWNPVAARTRLDGSELFRASPVGCFPNLTSADGPLDLAGNVWEWTRSRLLSYSAVEDWQREDPSGLASRAVRGSSWYDTQPVEDARSAARGIDLPGNVYKDAGFRVVVDEVGSFAYAIEKGA